MTNTTEIERMTTFELELSEDLPKIIHCITAPSARDNSVAEQERVYAVSSALQSWEYKYGEEMLDDIQDLINDMARHLVENCGYGG